jgi:hypothetical protein
MKKTWKAVITIEASAQGVDLVAWEKAIERNHLVIEGSALIDRHGPRINVHMAVASSAPNYGPQQALSTALRCYRRSFRLMHFKGGSPAAMEYLKEVNLKRADLDPVLARKKDSE